MSTVKVDTIQTTGGASEIAIDKLKGVATASSISVVAEGGSTTTNMQQGLAKHWCYFSMAGTSFSDSFNSSSLTDDSTGDFLVNMTTAFANLNYAVQASSNCYPGNSWQVNQSCNAKQNWGNTNTTTSYDFASYANSAYVDATYNYALGHGDLA